MLSENVRMDTDNTLSEIIHPVWHPPSNGIYIMEMGRG